MRKAYITFDLDGTIMQNPFVGSVFPEIEKTIQQVLGEGVDVIGALVAEHNSRMRNNRIVAAYDWDDIVTSFIFEHELNIEIDVVALVNKHSVQPSVYVLDDDVIIALQRLKSSGYSLIAATNGFMKYQLPVMNYLLLTPLFDEILTPEHTGFAKPDARMLQSLLTDGEIVAHVGDRIDHDVNMANEQGWASIWISYSLPEAVLRIEPGKRRNASLQLVKDKWRKEQGSHVPFRQSCVPNIVIGSLLEIEEVLGKQR